MLDAAAPGDIDQRFIDTYERNGRQHFNATLRTLSRRDALRQWHPLVRQAASAYRRRHFAITVPALLTVVEGVLMRAEGKRIRPGPVVKERIARLEARSPESITLILWRSAEAFISELYRFSHFDGPKPTGLNRHWILHGRAVTDWNQADSLRMFQAVETISVLTSDHP